LKSKIQNSIALVRHHGQGLFLFLVLLIGMNAVVWISCYEEKFSDDPSHTLSFSTDTLQFDTVLTQISTVTRFFKVYNPHDLFVRVEEIRVTGPQAQFFRINADGQSGDVIHNLEIFPEDSIYVFVEAVIDPDQPISISPFILEAEVSFRIHQQDQHVKLIAWGQNANYIPGPDSTNRILILSCDLGEVTWDDPKPYVLYGTLLIDSCTLVLPPGARLYVHGGIANNELGIYNEGLIYTLPHGKIEVRGTADQPVTIRDDRIEPDHEGEWAGIRLGPASGPHVFSHMRLQNGLVGLYADSASSAQVDHSILAFTAGPGVFARHAQVHISNSLFYENGTQSVALTYGGQYEIIYNTMSNFGNTAEALLLNNFYCTDPLCSEGVQINKLTALVQNNILIGSSGDEVWLNDADPGAGLFDISMSHNLVVVDDLLDPDYYPDFFTSICNPCFTFQPGDTLFVDMFMDDYHLDTFSIAERKAIPYPGISGDLEGAPRDPVNPDVGCYEFQ
jgi:hypothetical protein